MNRILLAVAVLSVAWAPSLAQDGDQLFENKVDALLRQWSEKTRDIETLYTEFNRTIVDPVWRDQDSSPGSARYFAPNKARLDILGGKRRESVVLPGTGEAWHYKFAAEEGQENIVEIHRLPEDFKEKDVLEEGPLPFLFATVPDKAKQRYSFEILEETSEATRVRILPKLEEDQRDFVSSEITLDRTRFLPTKIVIFEANKQQVTYDISNTWTNIELDVARDFAVNVPKGWKAIKMEPAPNAGGDRPPLRIGQK